MKTKRKSLHYTLIFVTTAIVFSTASVASSSGDDIDEVRALMAAGAVIEAKARLLACANDEVATCQFLLAEWIERGELFARDPAAAKQLYELAYRGGHEPAGQAILRMTMAPAGVAAEEGAATMPMTSPVPSAAHANRSADLGGKDAEAFGEHPLVSGYALPGEFRKWSPSAVSMKFAGAPPIFGFRLGQPDNEAFALLTRGGCSEPAASIMRRCSGTIDEPGGRLDVSFSLFAGRVESLGVGVHGEARCAALLADAHRAHGEPAGQLGGAKMALAAALLPVITRGDLPKSVMWWGRKNHWQLDYMQVKQAPHCGMELREWKVERRGR